MEKTNADGLLKEAATIIGVATADERHPMVVEMTDMREGRPPPFDGTGIDTVVDMPQGDVGIVLVDPRLRRRPADFQ